MSEGGIAKSVNNIHDIEKTDDKTAISCGYTDVRPAIEETDAKTASSCGYAELDGESVGSEEEDWPCFSDISALHDLRGELARTAHEAQQSEVIAQPTCASAHDFLEISDLASIGTALHGGQDCLPCKFLKCRHGCLRGKLCTMCHSDEHENLTYGMRNKLHKRKLRNVLIQPGGPDDAGNPIARAPKESNSESRSAPEENNSDSRPGPVVVVGKFYKPLGEFQALRAAPLQAPTSTINDNCDNNLQAVPLQPLTSGMSDCHHAESRVLSPQAVSTRCAGPAPPMEEGDDWSTGTTLHPSSCIPCKWMKRKGGCLRGNQCELCHSSEHENLSYGMRDKLYKRFWKPATSAQAADEEDTQGRAPQQMSAAAPPAAAPFPWASQTTA